MKSVGEGDGHRTHVQGIAAESNFGRWKPSTPWRAPRGNAGTRCCAKSWLRRGPIASHWLLTAVERGLPAAEICDLTKIDPWFINQIVELNLVNRRAASVTVEDGFERFVARSEACWKRATSSLRKSGRPRRPWSALQRGAPMESHPSFKRVDTCSAEFRIVHRRICTRRTRKRTRTDATPKQKDHDFGQRGPTGSGRELNSIICCVHASFALRADGF